jgi:integrase
MGSLRKATLESEHAGHSGQFREEAHRASRRVDAAVQDQTARHRGFPCCDGAQRAGAENAPSLALHFDENVRYAVDDLELIEKNPVKKGLAPKAEKTENPALREDQLVELFKVVPARMKAFFMTLALTGVRTGEALGLKWSDVDLASREIHVRRAIYRGQETTPKTNSSIRCRPMAPERYQSLLNHRAMAVYTTPRALYLQAPRAGRSIPTSFDGRCKMRSKDWESRSTRPAPMECTFCGIRPGQSSTGKPEAT